MKAEHITWRAVLPQVEERYCFWDFWPGDRCDGEMPAGGAILSEGRAGMSVGRESSTGVWLDVDSGPLLPPVPAFPGGERGVGTSWALGWGDFCAAAFSAPWL